MMALNDNSKNLESLLEIMQALRSPEGCPWDAGQTPESLTPFILEEACELIDAIEQGSQALVLDELGDLLFQVVFLAQIFSERKQFDFHDVAAGIADKLVRRHPHVFDRSAPRKGPTELDEQWDSIKRSETTHDKTCLADHLPGKLPALQRAQKLVSRVYKSNRQAELPPIDPQLTSLICVAGTSEDDRLDEESLGLALFQLARLAQGSDLDAEAALRKMTRKIIGCLEPD
jgi:MazG family protein